MSEISKLEARIRDLERANATLVNERNAAIAANRAEVEGHRLTISDHRAQDALLAEARKACESVNFAFAGLHTARLDAREALRAINALLTKLEAAKAVSIAKGAFLQ